MKSTLIQRVGALVALGLATAAQAGTFTDNFSVNRNYLTQGVVGTAYQGITAGEINPGTLVTWDANITAPGTLTITNTGGAWRNTGDGPFLWTMVNGDFTNTVRVSDMSQLNFNFAGLMVRNPDTNAGQSYVSMAIFAEFNIAIVYRDTISGSDSDIGWTPAYFIQDDKSTWPEWLQISRVGTLVTLNASQDGVNWEMVTQIDRPDLPADVQVGVFDSTFSANENYAQFQSFTVEGPNVGTATPPTQASGLTVTPVTKALNVSWTPGAGSAGSVVVVRRDAPVTRQPINGTNYVGDAVFGSGDSLGESNLVVFAGAGNSVTITNVTPSIPYTVAVYAYSGSGASTVYAISNAPVSTAAPLGNAVGISITYGATNAVAVDDTVQAQVLLHFDSGDTIQVSGATFASANTNIASITTAGLASGVAAGTVSISASYQTFNTSSNLTVVVLPVTEDFSAARNFLTQGVAGTYWHGVTFGTNDVPPGGVTAGLGQTTMANSGISKAGRLTVQSSDTGFDAAENDGFFLYRVIQGDFSIAIQVNTFNNAAFHMPGLMARAPFELAFAENSLAIVGFNEFNIGNFVRVVTSGAKAEVGQQFGQSAQPFIKLERQTNTFNFYQKAHALDSWTLIWSQERADLDGVAMQVGIVDQIFTANIGLVEFDNLVITNPLALSPNAPSGPSNLALSSTESGKVAVSWTAGAGSSGSIVVAHPEIPATRQPVDGSDFSATANNDIQLGLDLGGSNIVVFAGSGTSVTVSNLPPYHYTFTVYAYKTVGGTNYYNILSPASSGIDVLGVPIINPQPVAEITRFVGQDISIASGASPGSYRWQKDGADVANSSRISGALTSKLNINDLVLGDAGSYTFVVSNSIASVTSSPTVLTVLAPNKASETSVLGYGPAAFWQFEETSGATAFDYVGGFDGTHGGADGLGVEGPRPIDGFAHFTTTNLATQLPGNGGASAVSFPGLTPAGQTVAALTVTAWIKPFLAPADRAGIVTFTAPADSGLRYYGANGLSVLWNNSVAHTGLFPPLNQWSFVAMVVTPTGANVYLATSSGWQVFSDSVARPAIGLSGTGWIGSDRNILDRYFEGVIDEVAVFKGALPGSAITNLFNGITAPPSVTLSIQKIVGGLQLNWPQGTLLESTNVLGPWTTNSATSPYTISNPTGNKYFRVRVQ